MKNSYWKMSLVLVIAFAEIASASTGAEASLTCHNSKGRHVKITQLADGSYEATVSPQAGTNLVAVYSDLAVSTPHELGAPTIYSKNDFSITILSDEKSTWGTLNDSSFNIDYESVTCN